jgi:hypothetical protein
VYEGPFKDTGKWCKDFERFAKEKAFAINTWYMWYTTCPKCAKKYGKNYVVVLARWKSLAIQKSLGYYDCMQRRFAC